MSFLSFQFLLFGPKSFNFFFQLFVSLTEGLDNLTLEGKFYDGIIVDFGFVLFDDGGGVVYVVGFDVLGEVFDVSGEEVDSFVNVGCH